MSALDDTPERAAFEQALRVVISERDAWRVAGKFACEAFTAYIERAPSAQGTALRFYRADAQRAVEELQRVLKLSAQP
jgi:hypothetical protein